MAWISEGTIPTITESVIKWEQRSVVVGLLQSLNGRLGELDRSRTVTLRQYYESGYTQARAEARVLEVSDSGGWNIVIENAQAVRMDASGMYKVTWQQTQYGPWSSKTTEL